MRYKTLEDKLFTAKSLIHSFTIIGYSLVANEFYWYQVISSSKIKSKFEKYLQQEHDIDVILKKYPVYWLNQLKKNENLTAEKSDNIQNYIIDNFSVRSFERKILHLNNHYFAFVPGRSFNETYAALLDIEKDRIRGYTGYIDSSTFNQDNLPANLEPLQTHIPLKKNIYQLFFE